MSSKGLSNRIKLSSYDDMFSAENDVILQQKQNLLRDR